MLSRGSDGKYSQIICSIKPPKKKKYYQGERAKAQEFGTKGCLQYIYEMNCKNRHTIDVFGVAKNFTGRTKKEVFFQFETWYEDRYGKNH